MNHTSAHRTSPPGTPDSGSTAAAATLTEDRPGTGPAAAPPRRARRRREWPGAVFITPHMLALAMFMLVPTVYAVYDSMRTTRLIGGTHYSGFANYRTVLHSPEFWDGVRRVLVFTAIQVPLTIALAFFFAAVFDAGVVRYGRFFRTVFFMPFAVPGVVAAVMWSFLLLPDFGPYTKVMHGLGFGHVDFFSSRLILPTIVVIVIWEWTGYNVTILYTSLKSIPQHVTEAAILDGAKLSTISLRLKLPMVRPTIVMLFFLNTVGALQLFTEPSILAAFQPQAVSYGFTPSLYVYNTAVGSGDYNLGAAAAVVLALIIGALSLAAFAVRKRGEEFA
ncbi:Lactose transport system permease protein LacF [Streptomyces sp. RB17]|uniref:carbohydrate ABC transporter permease n=1 Tax=Streptomyces sp. RB17 TaxID=2585197 RepID=UPI00130CF483|nr:sugar ABC transporter permease [Streptomyces sp. RB17]MQY40798.1 Lactose transport system permease protein LacF [Streptomyces sp. RB17]